MNAIPPSLIPPLNGLDKEEPELAEEYDIPRDDDDLMESASAECGIERE